ncbi:transposase IS3/IS911 family protein [Acetohalobium arabaticum DSM 5501]|uniref:Transposase IS3/IS911 family protein n=1 Tax=Acetohalobium arabaticum (strain ATCC 49924 / DSM 5501 / Z-7288) TaxID=574087 RepID=D9QQU8_ACEAZ|nr:transposase IS3/IS911 family protein [Acetohalobium arabaticum DSM 5501]
MLLNYQIDQIKQLKNVSENLDIPYGTLIRWRREYKDKGDLAFPGHGKQKLTPEQKEIQRLKKELKDAKTERDILKKAVSIFSNEAK